MTYYTAMGFVHGSEFYFARYGALKILGDAKQGAALL
jgi:hypothetical protein